MCFEIYNRYMKKRYDCNSTKGERGEIKVYNLKFLHDV